MAPWWVLIPRPWIWYSPNAAPWWTWGKPWVRASMTREPWAHIQTHPTRWLFFSHQWCNLWISEDSCGKLDSTAKLSLNQSFQSYPAGGLDENQEIVFLTNGDARRCFLPDKKLWYCQGCKWSTTDNSSPPWIYSRLIGLHCPFSPLFLALCAPEPSYVLLCPDIWATKTMTTAPLRIQRNRPRQGWGKCTPQPAVIGGVTFEEPEDVVTFPSFWACCQLSPTASYVFLDLLYHSFFTLFLSSMQTWSRSLSHQTSFPYCTAFGTLDIFSLER